MRQKYIFCVRVHLLCSHILLPLLSYVFFLWHILINTNSGRRHRKLQTTSRIETTRCAELRVSMADCSNRNRGDFFHQTVAYSGKSWDECRAGRSNAIDDASLRRALIFADLTSRMRSSAEARSEYGGNRCGWRFTVRNREQAHTYTKMFLLFLSYLT